MLEESHLQKVACVTLYIFFFFHQFFVIHPPHQNVNYCALMFHVISFTFLLFFTVHIHTFSSRLFAVEKRYKVCVGGERKEDEKIVKKLEMW